MKSLNPNNRNPKHGLTFDQVASALREKDVDQIWVGNNTYAEWTTVDHEELFIAVTYHETKIVNILSNDEVQLFDGGYKTISTAAHMDWFTLPLGFRVATRNEGKGHVRWGNSADQFKIYSINTGAYRDYFPGIIVRKGEF